MRLVRHLMTLLLVAGLAVLPLSATAAMAHAAKAEMAMTASGGDCPCCHDGATKASSVACCHVSALLVETVVMPAPPAYSFASSEQRVPAAAVVRPDPPPPRVARA
jgi:hypothetical protein